MQHSGESALATPARRGRRPSLLLALLCPAVTVCLCGARLYAQAHPANRGPRPVEIVPAPPPEPGPDMPRRAGVPEIPPDFAPWWQEQVGGRLDQQSAPLDLSLDDVVVSTLKHSWQVRVLADVPVIRQSAVVEARARFDLRTFMESKFADTSDPVGSTLTTGGANRFIDQNWNYSAGVRKTTPTGAQFEASQKIGYQDNNSVFFVPTEQGTARLALSLTQPLWNGAGRAYNNSLIVLAEIDSRIAQDQLAKDLQALLLEVHRAYWDLYLMRAALLQQRRLQQQAIDILDELEDRRDVDVLGSQLARARGAVATREAAAIRFQTSVRNTQSRLGAMTNDPALSIAQARELVPSQRPGRAYFAVNLTDSLATALEKRPEIKQAAREIRAASVRADISKNELRPLLNLIVGTYVSGLEGDAGIGPALGDQFSMGRPTYSAGLLFEVPYGNHAARARWQQRRVELRRLTSQLETTVAHVRSEVEIAVREVATTYREMVSRYQAMIADEAEVQSLLERWRFLPGDQQFAGFVLNDLLDAQDRLAEAEFGFASAQVEYNVAWIELKRVTGTLLEYEEIRAIHAVQDHLPTWILEKSVSPRPPTGRAPPAPAVRPAQRSPPPVPGEARLRRMPVIR